MIGPWNCARAWNSERSSQWMGGLSSGCGGETMFFGFGSNRWERRNMGQRAILSSSSRSSATGRAIPPRSRATGRPGARRGRRASPTRRAPGGEGAPSGLYDVVVTSAARRTGARMARRAPRAAVWRRTARRQRISAERGRQGGGSCDRISWGLVNYVYCCEAPGDVPK